jgi:hypothetical protein
MAHVRSVLNVAEYYMRSRGDTRECHDTLWSDTMRLPSILLSSAAALVLATAAAPTRADAAPTPAPAVMAATAAPTLHLVAAVQDIKVEIDDDSGGAWYTQPMWIAIGVIALVVIVLLIAMAGRGGNRTTVVK